MRCNTCKSELVPVMYADNKEVAWICKCLIVLRVSHLEGYEYGNRVWRSTNYIQGVKCQNQPK